MGGGWVISGYNRYGCLYCGASFSTVVSPAGVEVLVLVPTGAFASAGVWVGDFVVSVYGQPVSNIDELVYAIESVPEGEPVEVVVYRPSTGSYVTAWVTF